MNDEFVNDVLRDMLSMAQELAMQKRCVKQTWMKLFFLPFRPNLTCL